MKNEGAPAKPRRKNRFSDEAIFKLGAISLAVFVFGLVDGSPELTADAVTTWGVFYPLYGAYLVRSVRLRDPPDDPWRTAAWVAYGALPFGLYIPFWTSLTAWPLSIAAYPAVVAWSSACLVMGGLSRPMRGSPRRRAAFLGVAGAICAVAAGPVYLGFGVAFVTGSWSPPDGAVAPMLLALVLGAPVAGLSAYAAIELLGRANRIDEPASQPG